MVGGRTLFLRCCNSLEICTVKHRTLHTTPALRKQSSPDSTQVIFDWSQRQRGKPQDKEPQPIRAQYPHHMTSKNQSQYSKSFKKEPRPQYSDKRRPHVKHVSVDAEAGAYGDDKIGDFGVEEEDDFEEDDDWEDEEDEEEDAPGNTLSLAEISKELSNFQLLHDTSHMASKSSTVDNHDGDEGVDNLLEEDTPDRGEFEDPPDVELEEAILRQFTNLDKSDSTAQAPGNILGDLESLFGQSEHQHVEEEELLDILGEEADVEEVSPNYDITVYHNIQSDGQSESYVLEGRLESGDETSHQNPGYYGNEGIPVDHILEYIRDNKGVDTVVLQVGATDTNYVEYIIITSVINKRQLKGLGAGLASICKHEYNQVWAEPVMANLSDNWVSLDTGRCAVHLMSEEERERVNLESFWLCQDRPEDMTTKEQYNQDLIDGLFPDEDFTKLTKPFELVYQDD